ERTDVSWISTEDKDFAKDIVLSRGYDDTIYRQNPIVVRNHDYALPAVGRNVWIKPKKSGETRGLIAKTHYPPKPSSWEGPWDPDRALDLVFLRLLPGKSVGFLPVKARRPTQEELAKDPKLYGDVRFIVEKWILLEYSLQTMPCNHNALVEACTKGLLSLDDLALKEFGIDMGIAPPEQLVTPPAPVQPPDAAFLTKRQYVDAITKRIEQFGYKEFAETKADRCINRFLGRV
ncbi:MAG: hypothetical protein ACRDH5_09685, partial [bacterium]